MANPDKFVLGPGFRGIIRRYGGDLAPELTAAGTSPNPHARTIEICFDDVEETDLHLPFGSGLGGCHPGENPEDYNRDRSRDRDTRCRRAQIALALIFPPLLSECY